MVRCELTYRCQDIQQGRSDCRTVADLREMKKGSGQMAEYRWSTTKPMTAGWYWFRGLAHEADPFIVQVDEVGQFQWPDGGFQEAILAKGEWAGPIEEPKE